MKIIPGSALSSGIEIRGNKRAWKQGAEQNKKFNQMLKLLEGRNS
jgi:hypothetical protein